MAKVKTLKDTQGTVIYPVSRPEAVYITSDRTVKTALDASVVGAAVEPYVNAEKNLVLKSTMKNILSGTTADEEKILPLANETNPGAMPAETYNTVKDNKDKIEAILGGSVAISNLPADPTQPQLTEAWKTATGRTELFNQAGIFDSSNNKIWTYYENDGLWHFVEAGGASVTQWGTGVAGIVTGVADEETNAGKLYAETDGTGSVIGWAALNTRVDAKLEAVNEIIVEDID